MYLDKTCKIYPETITTVSGSQKKQYTLLGIFSCDYWNSGNNTLNNGQTKRDVDFDYKDLNLDEETGLKKGDNVELYDQTSLFEGRYIVVNREIYYRADNTFDNIVYKLKSIDG